MHACVECMAYYGACFPPCVILSFIMQKSERIHYFGAPPREEDKHIFSQVHSALYSVWLSRSSRRRVLMEDTYQVRDNNTRRRRNHRRVYLRSLTLNHNEANTNGAFRSATFQSHRSKILLNASSQLITR